MPRWLHNTLFILLVIISMGGAMSNMHWIKKDGTKAGAK